MEVVQEVIKLKNKVAEGYVIPLGSINIVMAATDVGGIFCGAFDVSALEKFDYPAARVKPMQKESIQSVEDLLEGVVAQVNKKAADLGIEVEMTGEDALNLM